jgi:pimeloyl-ACP methyl ester carboxylesterase
VSKRPILVFSHANGFPAGSYRKMFAQLEQAFDIRAIERIGHDPRYPVTDGWPHLVAQLTDFIEAQAAGPVFAVGHSLGGYLSFLAAVQKPQLFSAIVLLDSPIIGFWTGTAFGMVKRFGMADRVTPAGITRERRREWTSLEAATHYFLTRKAFRHLDPDCVRDYARAGTVHTHDGVRLAFDPDIEYRIYRSIPHDLAAYAPRLRLAAGFVGGRQSEEVRRVGLRLTRRHFRVEMVQGGHLFPLERPQLAAQAIAELWAGLRGAGHATRGHGPGPGALI